jgi:hypothetical protein
MSAVNHSKPVFSVESPTSETPAQTGKAEDLKEAMLREIVAGNNNNGNLDRSLRELPEKDLTRLSVTSVDAKTATPITERLENIPYTGKKKGDPDSKFVILNKRPIVAVKIGDARVPFYVSTGTGGKDYVTPGKWYPLLGISAESGWFNKTEKMKDYYDSPKLRAAAEQLDLEIGDIRKDKELPSFKWDATAVDFLNRDFIAVERDTAGGAEHIEAAAAAIEEGGVPYPGTNCDCCAIL